MNRDLGAGAHATRFISLAAVANAEKAKWVHALDLQPSSQMSAGELCVRPEGCTESPYMLATGTKRPVRHHVDIKCSAAPTLRNLSAMPVSLHAQRGELQIHVSVLQRRQEALCLRPASVGIRALAGW